MTEFYRDKIITSEERLPDLETAAEKSGAVIIVANPDGAAHYPKRTKTVSIEGRATHNGFWGEVIRLRKQKHGIK